MLSEITVEHSPRIGQRFYFVKIVASTFIPGRRTTPSGRWSNTIFTGIRCTTLTKLPVAFSGGRRLIRAPVAPEMESTRPGNFPSVHVNLYLGALSRADIPKLRFLEVRDHPHVIQRHDRHETLTGLHDLAQAPHSDSSRLRRPAPRSWCS